MSIFGERLVFREKQKTKAWKMIWLCQNRKDFFLQSTLWRQRLYLSVGFGYRHRKKTNKPQTGLNNKEDSVAPGTRSEIWWASRQGDQLAQQCCVTFCLHSVVHRTSFFLRPALFSDYLKLLGLQSLLNKSSKELVSDWTTHEPIKTSKLPGSDWSKPSYLNRSLGQTITQNSMRPNVNTLLLTVL